MRMLQLVLLISAAWLLCQCAAPQVNTVATPKVNVPALGAVASTDMLATRAGLAILQSGGNAVDAAVATALALVVVNPQAGNLGGGGFAVLHFAGQVTSLDFREVAPAAAWAGMYLDAQGQMIAQASTVGPLAAGVPGSPSGYYALQQRYGRLPWASVVTPATMLAEQGLIVTPRLYASLARSQAVLRQFAATRQQWLPSGQLPVTGSIVATTVLAQTLKAYALLGPAAITAGEAAERLAQAARAAGGIITSQDLQNYRPVWRAPVQSQQFGWQLASMDLPSSGGIILLETLAILSEHAWPANNSTTSWHLLLEAWRRAYADRFGLGDPSQSQARAANLLAPAWIKKRAAEISLVAATPSAQVIPWSGATMPSEHDETTHLSVIDAHGNAVAMTVTLNGAFGCGYYLSDFGFFLNNQMDDFTIAPGQANMYGLVQGPANAIAPGKRMLSSMTPTLAWRGNQLLALGAPGGSRIPTATMQVFWRRALQGLSLDAAVQAPRLHQQWLPDIVYVENGALTPQLAAELQRLGHRLEPAVWHLGEVYAVEKSGQAFYAAADRRVEGSAAAIAYERR